MDEVKLSKALWCDLKTPAQKRDWLLLGRGNDTGVIAPAMQNDLAHDYNVIVEQAKLIKELQEELKQRNTEQQIKGYITGFMSGYKQCSDDEDAGNWTDDDSDLQVYALDFSEQLRQQLNGGE